MANPKKDKLGKGAPDVSSAQFSSMAKMSRKELGKTQAKSMPDEWDFENIERLLKVYDKAHPGRIKRMFDDTCTEIALSGLDKHATVSEASDMRKLFWLPEDLVEWFEKAYPSLWQEKKHAEWFTRKFPQFSFQYAASRVKTR